MNYRKSFLLPYLVEEFIEFIFNFDPSTYTFYV